MRDILEKLDEFDGLTAIGTADIDVDPEISAVIAARALDRAARGSSLSKTERNALKGYAELFKELISNPVFRSRLKDMMRLMKKKAKKDDLKKDQQSV